MGKKLLNNWAVVLFPVSLHSAFMMIEDSRENVLNARLPEVISNLGLLRIGLAKCKRRSTQCERHRIDCEAACSGLTEQTIRRCSAEMLSPVRPTFWERNGCFMRLWLVWRKQSGFCTSTNDPLKRGHLVKQILLLIIVLWSYELASKLDNMQHTTSRFHTEYASSVFAISNTVREQILLIVGLHN